MPEPPTIQVLRVHGPYEDAIISTNETIQAIAEGTDAATKAEFARRYLEFTKPLHELATAAVTNVAGWIQAAFKVQ